MGSEMQLLAFVVWFVTVANIVGALRRLFAAPRVRRAMDAVTGTVLIGLGVKLAART